MEEVSPNNGKWVEETWRWYHFLYTRKGFCVSQKRALVLQHQWTEGLEQLQSIVSQLSKLDTKSELSSAEKETRQYLNYLKTKLEAMLVEDQSVNQNLAATVVLLNVYRKSLNEASNSREREQYQELVKAAEARITELEKKRRAPK